ncbi:hypothetical protein FF1_037624 [Malus domestica]
MIIVPDVEGSKEDRCELTRTPYESRFITALLNLDEQSIVFSSTSLRPHLEPWSHLIECRTTWSPRATSTAKSSWSPALPLASAASCPRAVAVELDVSADGPAIKKFENKA